MIQLQPERREPVMDEDDAVNRLGARLESLQGALNELQGAIERLIAQQSRLRGALEAVEAAGRPHGSDRFQNPCECDQCQAWDAAKAVLAADTAAAKEAK